ncbi:MAG: purine-nucleoside phosphorylase [Planctomycetota bacterium]|jgi:purine-nucleoside phosphorylase|nr:purine-nucleoside phosphorylase [Planctomycetota bacterium]
MDYGDVDLLQQIVVQVRERSSLEPRIAVLLGTGLGGLAERIEAEVTIPYQDLTGMPVSTAESHKGELILGRLCGVPTVAFSGRLHAYEGHSLQEVVVPVRLAKLLGAETLIMASACGGMNPHYDVGEVAVLVDHINLLGGNPLVGRNDERLGGRWPDMIEPYSESLIAAAERAALSQQVRLHEAVYVAVLGPCLETRAEYRMLRVLGADLVGMSTVPETIAAVHCGMRVLAFGIVTDRCLPDALEPANIAKIIEAANSAEPVLAGLISHVLEHEFTT